MVFLLLYLSKWASPTYLDDVHICGAAGHQLVHFPHLTIGLHGNHFDGHRKAPAGENGRVHHLCVLQMEGKSKKKSRFGYLVIQTEMMHHDRDLRSSWSERRGVSERRRKFCWWGERERERGMSQTTETERFEGREGTEKQVIWNFLINVINMITFD